MFTINVIFHLKKKQSGTWRKNNSSSPFGTPGSNGHNNTTSFLDVTANNSLNGGGLDLTLALSPATPSQEAKSRLLRPKNLVERARLNVA